MEEFDASHPDWQGRLLLFEDRTLVHAEAGSRGRYVRQGNLLIAQWHEHDEETFVFDGTRFVSTKLRRREDEGERRSAGLIGGRADHAPALAPADGLPSINSFDVFDTLLARRCGAPANIFCAVELKSKVPFFTEIRQQAEAALYRSGQEYTLDDIYRRLVAKHGLSERMADRLRELELEEEYANLIPIAEHVQQVRPGDLLISDMYLPRAFIARILRDKCRLHFNPLILSSHGKSSGGAWIELQKTVQIRLHTGDNHHSDITMAGRHGIVGRHTQTHVITDRERMIAEMGFIELARTVREARLGFWHANPALRRWGQLQITDNFPLLFVLALRLLDVARSENWQTILLSSRDCHLLLRILRELAPRLASSVTLAYYFTSRLARAKPSQASLAYLETLVANTRAVIVDLCGTGWSLTRLLETADRRDIPIFLMHWIDHAGLMRDYRTLSEIADEPSPFHITRAGNNGILEDLNVAGHEMVTDVVRVGDTFVPLFLPRDRDEEFYELAACADQAVGLALKCTRSIPTHVLAEYGTAAADADVEKLYLTLRDTDETRIMRARQDEEHRIVIDTIKARSTA